MKLTMVARSYMLPDTHMIENLPKQIFEESAYDHLIANNHCGPWASASCHHRLVISVSCNLSYMVNHTSSYSDTFLSKGSIMMDAIAQVNILMFAALWTNGP